MDLTTAIRRLFGAEKEEGGILQDGPHKIPTKGFEDDKDAALPTNSMQEKYFRRKRQVDPADTLMGSHRFEFGEDNPNKTRTTNVGEAVKKRYVDLCLETRVPQRHLVRAVLSTALDCYEGLLRARLPYCKTKKDVEDAVKECFEIPLVKTA
jgi:hypothetical protein